MNRNTTVIIILGSVIALGIGGYFFFLKKTPTVPPATGTQQVVFPGESAPLTGGRETGVPASTEGSSAFVPGTNAPLPRLYELHKLPVAGIGFKEEGKGTNHTVSARYIERGLGHIYETQLATFLESRIVNETRSRIAEALWGNGGKSVVIRTTDETTGATVIKTSILNIGGTAGASTQSTSTTQASDFIQTEEVFLPDYIPFTAIAEDNSDKLFYLENGLGVSRGTTATFKNLAISPVFNSAFTEWLPQFPNQQLITLTTKPSASVPGYLFFVDPKTKSVTKIINGLNGLTTLTSHDGKFILFSETKGGIPELSVYDVAKKTARPLLVQTFSDKCAWGYKNPAIAYCAAPQALPRGIYPDQWYQGVVGFADALWEIDTISGHVQKIMTPTELSASPLDIINPILSSDDTQILFMNKTSGTPWVYRIVEQQPITPPSIGTTTPSATISKESSTTQAPTTPPSGMQQIK